MKINKAGKIIIMIISVLTAVIVWDLVYSRLYVESVGNHTHEQVFAYINESLQYNESEYDAYLEEINELIELPHISDSDKGHVYERMAQIYKFKNDTLNFYHTMGNALYYLEKAGSGSDVETAVETAVAEMNAKCQLIRESGISTTVKRAAFSFVRETLKALKEMMKNN